MMRLLKDSSPASRIFYLFLSSLIGLFLSGALIEILSHVFAGSTPDNVWMIRLSTFLQSLLMFFFPAFTIATWTDNASTYLNLNQKKYLYDFMGIAILLFIVSMPIISLVTQLNEQLTLPRQFADVESWMRDSEQAAQTVTQKLLQGRDLSGFISNILLIGAFTAISEEFFFRGVLQRELELWTKNGHVAVWLAAFIFSAIHLQFYGFFSRLILGALLGYLYLYTRSLWVPIVAHFFNNVFIVILYFVADSKVIDQLDNPKIDINLIIMAVVSTILSIGLIIGLKNFTAKKRINEF
jgi:membrane protease YdiL (CAAX protease family)